jgi:hypothetical protein
MNKGTHDASINQCSFALQKANTHEGKQETAPRAAYLDTNSPPAHWAFFLASQLDTSKTILGFR